MRHSRRMIFKSALAASTLAAGGLFAWQHTVMSEARETDNVPALKPFQKKLRIQNIETNVIDAGSGPPVLLFHGIPDTTDVWEATVSALKDQYRCITFDLPGFGRSHAVSGAFDWSLDNRTRFTRDILDALGVDTPLRLIGHDAGGVWAGLFAAAFGDRVDRALFSISSIHPDFEWRGGAKLNRIPVLGELAMTAFNETRFMSAIKNFSGRQRSDASIRQVYHRIDGRMRRAILNFYRTTNVEEFAIWHPLYLKAMAQKPVRVIWGELNPAATPEDGVRSFPTEDLIVYPEAGHWPMLEEPDRWAKDVLEFLARTD
jgi:pimeloyl-ACP methyl ester carboxylesterase